MTDTIQLELTVTEAGLVAGGAGDFCMDILNGEVTGNDDEEAAAKTLVEKLKDVTKWYVEKMHLEMGR